MVQRVRYCKIDNCENVIAEDDFKSELEVEPCSAPPRQEGLALLLSLQQMPQLKGHILEVKAPLGESTIWRPLQEVRVIPTGVVDIRAITGVPRKPLPAHCLTIANCKYTHNSLDAALALRSALSVVCRLILVCLFCQEGHMPMVQLRFLHHSFKG